MSPAKRFVKSGMSRINKSVFNGFFEMDDGKKSRFFTKNFVPGVSVYGEKLFKENNTEYREFAPQSSKLAAALRLDLKYFELKDSSLVLYLGSSTGTTVSHISDILIKGMVFGVDSAPVVMRELVFLAEQRKNIAPVLADASQPDQYKDLIVSVDFLYQDVAQKNQVDIFLKNLQFLKKGCLAFLVIKARSIDFSKKPEDVFSAVSEELKKHVSVLQEINISSFQKDHCMFICRKR